MTTLRLTPAQAETILAAIEAGEEFEIPVPVALPDQDGWEFFDGRIEEGLTGEWVAHAKDTWGWSFRRLPLQPGAEIEIDCPLCWCEEYREFDPDPECPVCEGYCVFPATVTDAGGVELGQPWNGQLLNPGLVPGRPDVWCQVNAKARVK